MKRATTSSDPHRPGELVVPTTGACPDGSPAAATQGTITATFLRP